MYIIIVTKSNNCFPTRTQRSSVLCTVSHITDPDMFLCTSRHHQGIIRTLGKQLKQSSLCTHRSMELSHSGFVSLQNPLYRIKLLIQNFGTMQGTLQLLNTCTKGKHVTCCEDYFIQLCQQHGLLTDEQRSKNTIPYSTSWSIDIPTSLTPNPFSFPFTCSPAATLLRPQTPVVFH
jgi:hypothetical protein